MTQRRFQPLPFGSHALGLWRWTWLAAAVAAAFVATVRASDAWAQTALPNGTADGYAQFWVDAFGQSTSINVPTPGVVFDPLGATYGAKETQFRRELVVRDVATNTSQVLGTVGAEAPGNTTTAPLTTALSDGYIGPSSRIRRSTFASGLPGVTVALEQHAVCAAMTQVYAFTNTTGATKTIELMWFSDADLAHVDPLEDDLSARGATPQIMQMWDSPANTVRSSITLAGGTFVGYRSYARGSAGAASDSGIYIANGGFPANAVNVFRIFSGSGDFFDLSTHLDHDTNNSLISDTPQDISVSLITRLTLGPGQTQEVRLRQYLEPSACELGANAGPDASATISGGTCTASIHLSGVGSIAPSGATYRWFDGNAVVATGATATLASGSPGPRQFVLEVCDPGAGACDYDAVTINVLAGGSCDANDDDHDGLTNGQEALLGSDPNDADSDDDGVMDGAEPSPGLDSDGDGKPNVLDPDSDNDGLFDGTELGITSPHADTNTGAGHFIPDADPSTTTNPLDPDTDDGGVTDGAEDANHNGRVDVGERDPNLASDDNPGSGGQDADNDGLTDAQEAELGTDPSDADSDDDGVLDGAEPSPGVDSDGDGLPNALDPDSDNDGLLDGTELGVTTPHADTNPGAGNFMPDADPSTTTNPLDPDTDDGGVTDGAEDFNGNGMIDPGELDPNNGADDSQAADDDGDGLSNGQEAELGTDPQDADSDDDGVLDGDEANPSADTDGDGLINPLDPDSDNDGLFDGTEVGITEPHQDTDPGAGHFVPDADPSTTTSPVDPDTDDGGVSDGDEDTDKDGAVDPGERDPNDPTDDQADPRVDLDGDGYWDGTGVKGGGCASAPAGGGGWPIAVAMAAACIALRRRRVLASVVPSVVVLVHGAGLLAAQPNRNVAIERFELSADRDGMLSIESARSLGAGRFDLGLWAGYEDDPFVVYDLQTGDRLGRLVERRVTGELVGAVGIARWLTLSVHLPVTLSQAQGDTSQVAVNAFPSLDGLALGDVSVAARIGLLRQERHGINLAIEPGVQLPTGAGDAYQTGDAAAFRGHLALSRDVGALRLGANLGYRMREAATIADLTVGDEYFAKIGIGVRLRRAAVRPIELDVALSAATSADDALGAQNTNHAELLGGASFWLSRRFIFFAAGGVGLNAGYGTPDWRALAGLRFGSPTTVAKRVVIAEDAPPQEPEEEPAPEPQDAPAPIDPDRDDDGVLDVDDACVNEPGLAQNGGCPDKDRDGDGLVDRLDNCPDEAGPRSNNGCKAKQIIKLTDDKIEVPMVYFKTGKADILPKSYRVLNELARVIEAQQTIRVVIEGHTDDRGSEDANKDLSQRRAAAVREYLMGQGIDGDRLTAVGYGEERPIASNQTATGRATNRRVEFIIQGSAKAIERRTDGPSESIDR